MTTRTILVTGASGFVGSAFVRIFGPVCGKVGYRIIPAVRRADAYDVPCLRPGDTILHLGACVDLAASLDELFAPNIAVTSRLAEWAHESGAYMIFASSVAVLKMDTAYARSKWLAERVIEASGAHHLSLRLPGIYGNNGPQHLGINSSIRQAQHGIVPTLAGDGTGKHNYLYVVDLVKLLVFCIKTQPTGTRTVGGPEVKSIADMVTDICDVFLGGAKPITVPGESSQDMVVEHSKELLWTTASMTGFKDALYHMKLWYDRENKAG